MELWYIVIVSLCVSAIIGSIFRLLFQKNLPPGPLSLPFIGNLSWLRKSVAEQAFLLRQLKRRYGGIITVGIGHRKLIFVSDHSTAHRALVQNGAVFADRPAPPPTSKVLNRTLKSIISSRYGPTWRLLRRNLTNEILNSSRVKSYSRSRKWVLSILIDCLVETSKSESSVKVIEQFQYAMFCLLVLMCFGNKLGEDKIREIESVQRELLIGLRRFSVLNFWPRLGKILFRNLWKEFIQLRQRQDRVIIPLIRSRIEAKRNRVSGEEDDILAYVDTLLDLHLPEENRKLEEGEMISMCSEFLTAGTDTTATALEWIMANLVKYPLFQARLYEEIAGVVGSAAEVEEEDLQKMPFLKALVLEGLRRHPPGHFVLPHTVTHDVELDGYLIPREATVNFMVADLGLDPKVWPEPLEFKPERFLTSNGENVDITGSKEIKMMPFGAGRRICPGSGLALLHLEYFVANLIYNFEWNPVSGEEVDLSEKQEFTVVMKNPLRASISRRR